MKITKRQLRRIIKEVTAADLDLYLDLGDGGDFPTLNDADSYRKWEVPYFTSAADFLDEVLSQLPGSTPDTIVYGEEMDLPDLPLSQVWDAVMEAGRRGMVSENFAAAASSSGYEGWEEDDFVDAIRDYSKELTGRRNTYGAFEDLEALTMIELQDYYEAMFDSPEAQAWQAKEAEDAEKLADEELGYEEEGHPLERSPLRQGMGRRQESIRRREKNIIENREDRLTLNLKLSPSGNDVELEVGESGETYNLGDYTDSQQGMGGLAGLQRDFEADHGMPMPPGTMVYDVDGVDIGDLPIEQMFQAVADMYAGF